MNGGALERLISLARRRFSLNLILEQSVLAMTLALACGVLLLIAGTDVLAWFWPLLLFVCAMGFGLWRIRARRPSDYWVAQHLDRELQLKDSLSTAYHFRNTSVDVFSEEIKSAQRAQAETHASAIDPALAVPLRLPAGIRWLAAATIAVGIVFAVRYGVQQSLDLTQPLIAFDLDPFGSSAAGEAAKGKGQGKQTEDLMKTISVQPPEVASEQGLDPAPDSALGVVDVPDVDNSNAETASRATSEKGPGAGDTSERDESAQGEGAGDGDPNSADNNEGANTDPKSGQQAANQQQSSQPGENSSMMDKMRDALSNLMAKMSEENKQPGDQQRESQNPRSGQPSASARQQQAKKGMQSKGQQSDQQQSSDQQSNEDMNEADPSQSTQGKPGDKNSQQAANQQNKSGMGKQDGGKDVELAEQLEAMGKISEIIGKRNANLQGEIMIEVNSSKQSLKTQYSQRDSAHTESGAEIRRDEIPLAYQSYVQQYFEEVRKAPRVASPAPAPARTTPAKTTPAESP